MKHFRLLIISFISLLTVPSCTDREIVPSSPETAGRMVIRASSESAGTRTSVCDSGSLLWSPGDCISVLTSESNSRFSTSISEKSALADFEGPSVCSSTYIGLYPYSQDALSDGSCLSTDLPACQKGVAGSFADSLFIAVARTEDPSGMDFMNVCSGLRFKLSSSDISSVIFRANGGEALAGRVTVAFREDGTPYVSEVTHASSEVSLSPADGDAFIPGEWYYIVTLPAILSKGFTLSFVRDGAPYSVSSASELALRRSGFGSIENADGRGVLEKCADDGLYWEEEGFKNIVTVTYSGEYASVSSSTDKIKYGVSGADVWVNLGDDATGKKAEIIVSGASDDGSLKIYGEKKYKLTLNGLKLKSQKGPAVNAQNGKRMFLHLVKGTENVLEDAAAYQDDFYYADGASAATEQRKACLFAEGRIIVSGTGSLCVTGNHGNAITTDDFFYMRPGPQISIPGAAGHGLKVGGIATPAQDDYDSDGDLIGCTVMGGSLTIAVSEAGSKAINCEGNVKIAGGTLDLKTAADAVVQITDSGRDTLATACIKADGDFKAVGGRISCVSTGTAGKGLNVDGNIVIGSPDGGRPVISISTTGGMLGTSGDQPGMPPGGIGGWGGPGIPGWGPVRPGGSGSGASYAKAIRAEGTVIVYDCDMEVYTAGSGAEGLESKQNSKTAIQLLGGRIRMYCSDDCINASAGGIVFGGAEVFAWSSSNDAIDSNYRGNGAVTISGGAVIAVSSAGGMEEGFDSDESALSVTGGYAFTMGRAQGTLPSVPNQSTAVQCTALMTGLSLTKGEYLSVSDASGVTLFSVLIPFSFSGSYSVVTCPGFVRGNRYTVSTGNSAPTSCTDAWRCVNISPSYEIGLYYQGRSSASSVRKTLSFTSNYIKV